MKKFEEVFVDCMYAKKGKYDFIKTELDVNVEQTIQFLNGLKEYAKDRKGIVRISILESKKDPERHYAKMVKWKEVQEKPEVKAVEQMPDRETEDLPF